MSLSRNTFLFWSVLLSLLIGGAWIFWQRTHSSKDHRVRVCILQVVEHPALDRTRQGILDVLREAFLQQGKEIKISYESAQGNPTLSAQIATKCVSERPNILIGISTPSAQSLLSAARKTAYPIIFSSVTDPLGANLVTSLEHPQPHITGVSNQIDLRPQIELIQEIMPKAQSLGIIYNPGEANSVTLVSQLKTLAPQLGLEIVEATASKSADVMDAARRVASRVDAIFITNDSTALSAFDAIAQVSVENQCPLFTSDIDQVGQGAVAAFGPNQYALGRQTGEMVLRRLQQSNTVIPVEFPKTLELHIDKDAAKKVNLILSGSVLEKAHKIYDRGVS